MGARGASGEQHATARDQTGGDPLDRNEHHGRGGAATTSSSRSRTAPCSSLSNAPSMVRYHHDNHSRPSLGGRSPRLTNYRISCQEARAPSTGSGRTTSAASRTTSPSSPRSWCPMTRAPSEPAAGRARHWQHAVAATACMHASRRRTSCADCIGVIVARLVWPTQLLDRPEVTGMQPAMLVRLRPNPLTSRRHPTPPHRKHRKVVFRNTGWDDDGLEQAAADRPPCHAGALGTADRRSCLPAPLYACAAGAFSRRSRTGCGPGA